jgi:hypothetical protein
MRTLAVTLACVACLGHASSTSEPRDWELENLARYNAGEINDAELGMANVIRASNDPEIISEVWQMMNDPKVQELMADPDFREQAEQIRQQFAPRTRGGARDWEVRNALRSLSGDLNEAELGVANLQQAASDPSVMGEVMQQLQDPDFVAQLEEMLQDPTFQEQALQAIAEAREATMAKKSSKTLASLLFAMSPAGARLARTSKVNMETNADLQVLAKKLNPAVGYFDPLKLGSDERGEAFIGFMRHAEIKHGRVAMAGFVGFCITANGFRWPLEQFQSVTASSPLEQWDAMPKDLKWNLVLGMSLLEGWGELRGTGEPHYMRGGKPGYYPPFDEIPKEKLFGYYPGLNLWDPLKFNKNMSPEKKEKKLIAELNNGRLAMLGIAAFIGEAKVPGSVPLLKGVVAPYDGDVMLPPGLVGWFAQ